MPSKSARKRQSRLEFTPLPSSSPAARGYHQQIRNRAAAVTIEGSPSPAKRRRINTASLVREDADQAADNGVMPTPAATAHGQRDGSDDELAAETAVAAKVKQNKRRQRQQQLDFSNNRDADTFDSPVKLASSSRSRLSKVGVFSSSAQPKMVELSSSDESDVVPRSSRKKNSEVAKESKRKTRGSQRPVVLDDSDEEAGITFTKPQVVQVDSDDDDDMPTTQGKQSRTRRRRMSNSSFINDSSPPLNNAAAADSDSDVIEVGSSRKRRRQDSEEAEAEEDDEEEDKVRHPAPKTPGRLAKRSRKLSWQEKEDLEEDLDFLGPSSDAESGTRPSTQSAQKSARQKALEKLKAKRGKGLTQVAEEDEEEDDEDERGPDQEEEAIDLLSDDEDSVSAPPMSSRRMFAADENDEDFLVEEEEESTLGVPDGIPLAFTRYASMKPKELFRYAVDWMVQKHINPGFNMSDEIYELTFKKLDDEVRGLAGSKFESSAWTPEFTIALKARHHIAYHRLDRTGEHWGRDKCDACNRSGHPATYEVQFHGKPYYRETLEDVENGNDDSDSDSEDGADPDAPTYDAQSREVLPESTSFYLGKFCMSNAITAHELNHWRYHMRQAVDDWLEVSGYNKPQKLVERSKLSTRKLRKKANKIVEKMEEAGEVSSLWKAFREKIDTARNSKQGRYRFGGDSP